ncbi:hypothetical protein IC582_001493 [Cucumis melo]
MIRTTNHHCVDLIIAHLKRIYNFPFANRLQRRGGRKQIEISTVQNCHSYSIYYWVFFFSVSHLQQLAKREVTFKNTSSLQGIVNPPIG